MITVDQWDQHYYRIREDAINAGIDERAAADLAERETVEQFGPHPEDPA